MTGNSNLGTVAVSGRARAVHIWTNDFCRYPLDAGFTPADLAISRFAAGGVLSQALDNGVGRVVLVQMSYCGLDNSLMLDAIPASSGRFRGIAVIDENQTDLPATVRGLRQCGVRGFRVMAIDPSMRLSERPGLRNMLEQVTSGA
ncbi:MAG TPA: hypothetical protein VN633_20100 [Bryobacteraceae bacterium]|nr:hypothetical protein [Bryobacteraceae bacterium]